MSIAFDATSNGTGTTAHTCSGSNRLLLLSAISLSGTSTPTYNGVSMTLIRSETTTQYTHSLYYLIAPATGSNNIVCTGGAWVACSYTGVNQTTPIDSQNSGKANDYTVNVSTTVVASSCWLVSATGSAFDSNTYTAQSNRTDRGTSSVIRPLTPYMNTSLGDSNGLIGSGSQSTTHSNSSGTILHSYSVDGIDISILGVVLNYPLTLTQSSFSYSGYDVILSRGFAYILSLAQTSFSYTGYTLSFILDLYTRVTNRVKHATIVTNRSKTASASVTNRAKHATTVTNRPKS